MQIGNVKLVNPLVLAPMAGVTDSAFRVLVKEQGCGLLVSEMVSAKGLLYNNEKTLDMLTIEDVERPVAIQLFGRSPEEMAEAAKRVEANGADMIDINMGCPVPKIVNNGEGSALMKEPDVAGAVMSAVAKAVRIPVTVKIRAGWDETCINAVPMAKIAEEAGMAAIAVHARTRQQFYSGHADWNVIRDVRRAVAIPVIGNGDVRSAQDVVRMMHEAQCQGVMIGRAAEGNPWIFAQAAAVLAGEAPPAPPSFEERSAMMLRHLERLTALKGERAAVREMRHHAANYTKGLPFSAEYRMRFCQADTQAYMRQILQNYEERLKSSDMSHFRT